MEWDLSLHLTGEGNSSAMHLCLQHASSGSKGSSCFRNVINYHIFKSLLHVFCLQDTQQYIPCGPEKKQLECKSDARPSCAPTASAAAALERC
jgi:hypothetical protein